MDLKIKEYANGKFQVWDGDKVLRPGTTEWENSYQYFHDFMFFSSYEDAEIALELALEKKAGLEVVKEHRCG